MATVAGIVDPTLVYVPSTQRVTIQDFDVAVTVRPSVSAEALTVGINPNKRAVIKPVAKVSRRKFPSLF
jgi:hypothetical protein